MASFKVILVLLLATSSSTLAAGVSVRDADHTVNVDQASLDGIGEGNGKCGNAFSE